MKYEKGISIPALIIIVFIIIVLAGTVLFLRWYTQKKSSLTENQTGYTKNIDEEERERENAFIRELMDKALEEREAEKIEVKIETKVETQTEPETNLLEKAVEKCQGLEENFKQDGSNVTFLINVEKECYLIEAARTGEGSICEEIEDDNTRCLCGEIVKLLEEKSEAFREEIIDDTKTSYQLAHDIVTHPELKPILEDRCPVDDEGLIEYCKSLSYDQGQYCLFHYAIASEKELFCDEIDSLCLECACDTTVGIFKQSTEEEKEELRKVDISLPTLIQIVEEIISKEPIKSAIIENCSCFELE